jgi:hypothetical protein
MLLKEMGLLVLSLAFAGRCLYERDLAGEHRWLSWVWIGERSARLCRKGFVVVVVAGQAPSTQ